MSRPHSRRAAHHAWTTEAKVLPALTARYMDRERRHGSTRPHKRTALALAVRLMLRRAGTRTTLAAILARPDFRRGAA